MAKKRRDCRPVSGIFLLDKPAGISSNAALQEVKRQFRACKAGHAGSLDPLATGLLPICLGEAAKVAGFLLDADKRYAAVFKLGETTDTFDAQGKVTQTRPVMVSQADVEMALARFSGWIEQIPPMYSAIKQNGQPLYKRARAGVTVERAARRVHIGMLQLRKFAGDRVEVEVACSKGTYIRSLAHDIGEVLGCGAHVLNLRRLVTAGFTVGQALRLEELEHMPNDAAREACLLSVDAALTGWPEVRVTHEGARRLYCGLSTLPAQELSPGWVRLYDEGGCFLGMGEVRSDGSLVPKRLMALATVSERGENSG